MKKALGLLCGLTVLTACSLFEDEKTMADAPRHSPMLNGGDMMSMGALSPSMPIDAPMNSAMPPMGMDRSMPPMGMGGGMPIPPEPPISMPLAPVAPQMAAPMMPPALTPPPLPGQATMADKPILVASASDASLPLVMPSMPPMPSAMLMPPTPPEIPSADAVRRPPEFNRSVLSGQTSGDVVSAAPTVRVMQMPTMPQADDSRLKEYPKLAQVPPAPAVHPSIDTDSRVKAMREELSRMEQPAMPSAPPMPIAPVIVAKTEIKNEALVLPPAPMNAMPSAPPMPMMAPPPPIGYSAPLPPAPASTSLSDLRPLPASGGNLAPAPVIASASDPYTNVENLTPLSGGQGHYRTIADSRYAKIRIAARNATRTTR